MGYKKIDGLMRHLRNHGISIAGSTQKRQLLNSGYYHGYKGYRFFHHAEKRIPFSSFEEIYFTIQYDTRLKTLFYPHMMFIETALKSIAITCILDIAGSESIQSMYDIAVSSYNNSPKDMENDKKRKLQERKLSLQSTIQTSLATAYKRGNPKITHFYNNMSYSGVPLWALFEILTMGDFGYLLSCLTYEARDAISKKVGIDLSTDTNRELIYKYVYAMKDLRNAIAHNEVIFDTRFRKIDPSKPMIECLKKEIGLDYVNFKSMGDYVILVAYFLHLLKLPKKEIKAFLRDFQKIVDDYKTSVSTRVSSVVIHPDWTRRIKILRDYL